MWSILHECLEKMKTDGFDPILVVNGRVFARPGQGSLGRKSEALATDLWALLLKPGWAGAV
jgi:hypothetical protein